MNSQTEKLRIQGAAGAIEVLRDPISRLRCSPYTGTAALLGATSGRSRRSLPTFCQAGGTRKAHW